MRSSRPSAMHAPSCRVILPDPPVLHTVAAQYGEGIASGQMTPATARVALARICIYHPRIPDIDAALNRAITTCDNAAFAQERQAAEDIRIGLQPLLRRRAPTAVIRQEAYRLASARLLRPDCDAIVNQEIAAKLHA